MSQLLVSVRNACEAIAAVEGGADIIDVKEPDRGSLGCAAPDVIRQIAAQIQQLPRQTLPLSLALGELEEWRNLQAVSLHSKSAPDSGPTDFQLCANRAADLRTAILGANPQFLKIGLAGVVRNPALQSWKDAWAALRQSIPGQHSWVAVAYADHKRADSPPVQAILDVAVDSSCRVLLIDTHQKDGSSLLDWLTLAELQTIRKTTRLHGMQLALAGRVVPKYLPQLLPLEADIIAVRGAVCDQGNRQQSISKDLVAQFRLAMAFKK